MNWISVKDRLPDHSDDVLCWYEYFRFGIYNRMYQTCGNTLIPHEATPETVGQYTGLTDMNGRKVFEGDIVKIEKYLYRVYFDTSMACFEFCKICDNWDTSFYKYADLSKIIGNIHDDPELLKGESNESYE